MKNTKVQFLTQGALIAAIYVVLTIAFKPLSFGAIQVRFAEALTILPLFTPAAIPGLFVGCLIGNTIGMFVLPDIIFGSIATLIGALGTFYLRNRTPYIAPLPPILANTLIIPFILRYAYGVPGSIPLLMGTIGIGEILSCGILGLFLYKLLRKYPLHLLTGPTQTKL